MFTGIIEEMGRVSQVSLGQITIEAQKVLADIQVGSSISINGVCLTVTEFYKDKFVVDIMPETLKRSNLDDLKVGDRVNLERALKLQERLGGHIVTGHIDEVGRIESIKQEENAKIFEISHSPGLAKYIIPKGSIAVDGISLTVITDPKSTNTFKTSIIPHTLEVTTLGIKGIGGRVNLEADLIGKYVARLLGEPFKEGKISLDFLREHGFA